MGLMLGGISVSQGITIGAAYLLKRDDLEISEYPVPLSMIDNECARYKAAIKKSKEKLKSICQQIPGDTPSEIVAFVDAHLLMLDDSTLSMAPLNIIRSKRCNAEWALKLQRDELVAVFDKMDDPYLKTRKDDVDHVVNSIQRMLLQQVDQMQETKNQWLKDGVVIADDLAPSDTMIMQQQGVSAIITEFGGANSHTAILARSLGIPAIVGVHNIHHYIRQGDLLVVDGSAGVVLAGLDETELEYFRKKKRIENRHKAELNKLKKRSSCTVDGTLVSLMANIELPTDLPMVRRVCAAGVGLYRTEMLFMNRTDFPGEEEQFRNYRQVVKSMKGIPVTIRSLDLGADKQSASNIQESQVATNPALGLRAVRWCLKDPSLFRPQLRAILRASHYGTVRLMVPMLSGVQEMVEVRRIMNEEKNRLKAIGRKFDPNIPVGCMIEVPAAALAADMIAKYVDFFSIGTNDLIQYTLAVDRRDDEVNYLFDPMHPAILRLINMVIKAGKKANIPVAMCGEMAGDMRFTRLLLGMGLREFSMLPASLLQVKQIVKASDVTTLTKPVKKILKLADPSDIQRHVSLLNCQGSSASK
ncbi:MAG: phosphoenolpyruvate--protein phosphotransferase [Gammaproteobacteria bacterium]